MEGSVVIDLIGYWNKDSKSPKIIFNMPDNFDDWQLVTISIKPVKDNLKASNLNEINMKKLTRESKKLLQSFKGLKNVKK